MRPSLPNAKKSSLNLLSQHSRSWDFGTKYPRNWCTRALQIHEQPSNTFSRANNIGISISEKLKWQNAAKVKKLSNRSQDMFIGTISNYNLATISFSLLLTWLSTWLEYQTLGFWSHRGMQFCVTSSGSSVSITKCFVNNAYLASLGYLEVMKGRIPTPILWPSENSVGWKVNLMKVYMEWQDSVCVINFTKYVLISNSFPFWMPLSLWPLSCPLLPSL